MMMYKRRGERASTYTRMRYYTRHRKKAKANEQKQKEKNRITNYKKKAWIEMNQSQQSLHTLAQ